MNLTVRRLLAPAGAFALIAATAHAQTTTARLSGTITDGSGAVVGNAHIFVQNLATGEDRHTDADSAGTYVLVSLKPSEYSFRATAPGFSSIQLARVTLQVGQEFVWSPRLAVSSDSVIVTVEAGDLSVLDTSSARIGGNVSQQEIEQLPLNGRQISQLYLLTPGATNTGTGNFDNIHFSGRAVEENILRIDGIEAGSIISQSPGNLNGEITSVFRLQQSLEAVQEFRVDSSSYPAELGTGTGGQISFLSKSGTNKVHGSAFEYLRNDYADARNTFNVTGSKKFRLDQFGGSLGGPLVGDRLFAFGSYEGLRQVYVQPYSQSTLSSYSRSLVPALSPIAALLAAFPSEPGSAAAEAGNTVNGVVTPIRSVAVSVNGQNRIQEDFGDVRFDYRINDRFSAYARYNRDQGNSTQVQDASLSQFGQIDVPQNGVLALNQVLSPRIFNETKIGFNSSKQRVLGISGPSPNADLSRTRIAVAGLTNVGALISLSSSFNGVGAPYTAQSYSYIDNFSVVIGRHNTKFGVEARPLSLYNDQIGGTTYTYNAITDFTGDPTLSTPLTPNRPAQIQFFGNLSDTSPFTGLSGNAHLRQEYYIGYAQDEWKMLPNLTLSYGMRYEYYSPLHELRNKDVVFSIPLGTILPGYAGDWYRVSKKNFGPRLGLTFAPDMLRQKTVLRAGAGIFYGPGQTEDQLQPEANDRVSTTFAASAGKAYPINPATDVYATYNINNPNLNFQPRAYAADYVLPERVATYTLSVEQQLPYKLQLMVAYVGSVGRNLFQRSITNTVTGVYQAAGTGAGTAIRQFTAGAVPTTFVNGVPNNLAVAAAGTNRFAEIDYKTSHGSDSYNSFQSTLQRRFNGGLSFGAQYTFAKELGTTSGSNEATTAADPFDFSTEYGRGTNDIRHSMNASALYDLPFGHGKNFRMHGIADAILGGYQMGGIVNLRSGLPIDVLITRPDLAFVGIPGSVIAGRVFSAPVVTGGVVQTQAVVNVPGGGNSRNIRRPDVVAGVSPYLNKYVTTGTTTNFSYLNPAAFSVPAPGTFGNARRNGYDGPGLAQLDLTLAKTFAIFERTHLELKGEAFNILNHPNLANPGTVRLTQGIPTSATTAGTIQPGTPFTGPGTAGSSFGNESATVGNQVGIGTNRQLQISARVTF